MTTAVRRRSGLVTVVAAALCVPVGAAVAMLAGRATDDAATQRARTQAVVAAERAAVDVLSYDFRTMHADISRAESEMTPAFRRTYAQTAGSLASEAARVRAIVQATASSPGVVSADRDQVVVLVFVDQAAVRATPGAKTPTTRIDQNRVRLTMARWHGRWLVAQLAAL